MDVLIGLCAACLAPILLLRKNAPEQALLLTAAVLAAVLLRGMRLLAPAWESLQNLLGQTGIAREEYGILLRVAGITLLSRLCGALCKDSGSLALSAAVELAGSAGALIAAMPLLERVLRLLMRCFG